MVPQHFVFLDAMPQTNNGKIDYKALPAPSAETVDPADIAMPNTPAEKYLASVWEEILELDDIGLNDTFFDIGGHSLLVMKVITEVHEKTGVKLGPQDFLISTLEQLADKLSGSTMFEGQATEEPTASAALVPAAVATPRQAIEPIENAKTEVVKTQVSSESAKPETNETETNETETKTSKTKTNGVMKMLKGFWD